MYNENLLLSNDSIKNWKRLGIHHYRKKEKNSPLLLHLKKIRILYFYSFFTLFEIFLFCPKIQLRLPRIIFLGEKLMKMLGFWTF